MNELINKANEALDAIKEEIKSDVIKNKMIHTLTNVETLEDVGIVLELTLNPKYRYNLSQLNEWSKQFGADDCFIALHRNQLLAKFHIHK